MTNTKEKNKELFTAKYDKIFKTIMFEDKELLGKILETVLQRPIKVIDFVIQDLPVRKKDEKRKTVDIIAKSNDEYLNVEINTSAGMITRIRNLNYFTSFFSQNTVEGDKYDLETKYILINLTFGMNKQYGKNKYKMTEVYKLRTKDDKLYYENFEIVEVNMDKVMELWYSKNEKEIEDNKFLIMLDLKTEEELEKICKGDILMKKFKDKIVGLNSNATFVRNITPEEDEILVRNTELYYAKKEAQETGFAEGHAEGHAEGRAEGRAEGIKDGISQNKRSIAIEMLKDNVPIEKISRYTGLSIENIQEIMDGK